VAALDTRKYPKKSHRKQVRIPDHSPELAEFFGIMMGDGSIGNSWQANITLNSIKDAMYAPYIKTLCEDLFGVSPSQWKRKERNALVISLTGTTIIDFLVSEGLVRGNKLKQGLQIPQWILQDKVYRRACVRGLMDTDGGLYIHRHKVTNKSYRNIGLCFTSYSYELIQQVATIFEEYGIIPHISGRKQNIYLYRADSVAKYLAVFGTSNERIRSVYQEFGGVG
jgi:DNA-binding transcriptional regulator WhiA